MNVQGALQKMLARAGKTPADFSRATKMGKIFRAHGVQKSPELERVLRLPRRIWKEDEALEKLVADMTAWLKTPAGTMTLRPIQAKALEELHDFGGLLAPIRVGGGKTIISMLAPVVLGAARPLLVVPAKLRDKTIREFAELRRHWLWHPKTVILSYEQISRDKGFETLEKINPDLIVADEIHRAKSSHAGVTRKLRRWADEHPETRWALMSGTITTRSLRDYAHLAKWALKDLSPLPKRSNDVAEWADALDTKIEPNRRLMPGALLGLCDDEELTVVASDASQATAVARKAFRRRLVETPAVVATEERALGVSLEISHIRLDLEAECGQHFKRLREDWETPGGEPFSEAVDLWRHARELSCGFFYRWSPPAPQDWLDARREWNRFVRDMLGRRRHGIDTPFQVAKACKAGEIPRDKYDCWDAVRDTFKPHSVPVWCHQKTLELAANWLEEAPGICWIEHIAYGRELSKLTGCPYFAEGGLDSCGVAIEETKHDRIIASIASNSEGRNLQRWNRNLLPSCPPNGRIFEQLLGRTHREGQLEDEVECQIVFACIEQWSGFGQALRDAQYVQETTGQPQKLLYADKDIPTPDQVFNWGRTSSLWRTE